MSAIDEEPNTDPCYVEPKNFKQAWHHEDPVQREKWRTAIRKEFGNMSKHQVYGRIARSKIPKLRRCVKLKWVFKIKRDGRFRSCLVACGYL